MRFRLKAGGEVDTLTQEELKAGLTQNTAAWFQEKARGVSTARFDATGTPATGALSLPAAGKESIGPEPGFVWALQRVTAAGLGTADVLLVYRNSVMPSNLLGSITATAPFKPGSKGVILRGRERLFITGTGLTATGDVTVNGESVEVAESDLYKVL